MVIDMDGLEPGAYGVLARYPGGGMAAVERSFPTAKQLAVKTLRRFQRSDSAVDSLPREPGALLRDYTDAFTARLLNGRVEVVLVRFFEDPRAPVPLEEAQVLAIRANALVRGALLVGGRRLAWDAAAMLRARFGDSLPLDVYSVDDRRPLGGLVMRAEPRLVTAGQAIDTWARRLSGPDFDAQLADVAATAG
jgi:hypothetical protein